MSDLKKQLETTENTIKALQEHAESLRSMLEKETPKKWSPVGGGWWIDITGSVDMGKSNNEIKQFGIERPTKEQAERAAVEMRKFNRLLALRDELWGDDLPDWESKMSDKWRVYRDNKHGKWGVGKDRYMQDVGVYFTKEEHAKRACDMLNSGEVEL
jgi:hypothetical protein